jgi:Tol biopolymer transport system component
VPNLPCQDETTTNSIENYDTIIPWNDCPFDLIEHPSLDYHYTYPIFNPNNSMEIAYIKENIYEGIREIWKFNLCTGEKHLITDNARFHLDWSVKDWIVYTGTGNQLYKVKSDGDSLIQITNAPGLHREARWNEQGSKIVYINWSDQGTFIILANESGIILDSSIKPQIAGIGGLNWKDGKITGGNTVDSEERIVVIGEIDFETEELTPIDILDLPDTTLNLHNSDFPQTSSYIGASNKLFYTSEHQMYVYDINTQSRTIITTGADNRGYESAEVSSDGKTIIYTRIDRIQIDNCNLEYTELLYLMDIDGGNERIIEIPE